jgi:DNA-binding transcriptional ArsR family regulator
VPAEAALFAVPVFAALGDETRLRIVLRLGAGPQSIVRLTHGSTLTRQAVTKHLNVLQKAGLVSHARSGRETVWTLERDRVDQARHYLGLIARQWDEKLESLRAFVEP